MLIIVKVVGDEVYIMDTDDNCIVESVPKGVYLQSKVLGIPVDDRYIEELSPFKVDVLRAGFFEMGIDDVLSTLRDIEGQPRLPELVFNKLPIDKLLSVVSDAEAKVRLVSNVDYAELISSGAVQEFKDIMNSLSVVEDSEDSYEEEEFEDDLFGSEEDIDLEPFQDDDEFDYGDVEEFDYDESSNDSVFLVSQLYNKLSQEEVGLLDEYSKFHSRLVFKESNGDLGLSTNNSSDYRNWKRQELSNIHGDENWVYEGYVDTGAFPGGYCEMGHPLRYIHFARGVKSGKIVKFGIKCIGDFFEVDSSVTNGLLKAQRENLSDLLELSQIYSSNESVEGAKKSFYVFNILYKAELAKEQQQSEVFAELLSLIDKFNKAGLVYPKSMTKLFKVLFFKVDTLKDLSLRAEVRSRVIEDCFGSTGIQVDTYFKQNGGASNIYYKYDYSSLKYPTKSFMFSLVTYLDLVFNTNLEGIYKYNPIIGLNVRGEGGKSKTAIDKYKTRQIAAEMFYAYALEQVEQYSSLVKFFDIFNKAIEATNLFNSFTLNWKKPYLNAYDLKYKNLSSVQSCKTASAKMLDFSKRYRLTPSVEDANKVLSQYISDFESALPSLAGFRLGFSDICKTTLIEEDTTETKKTFFIELDFTDGHFNDTLAEIDASIKFVQASPLEDKFNAVNKFPLDVLTTIRSKGWVSDKQRAVLERFLVSLEDFVNRVKNNDFEAREEDTEIDKIVKDCERAIEILDSGKYFREVVKVVPTYTLQKLKSILSSICSRRSASEKQMYYVNIARNVLAEIDKSSS